MNASTYFIYYLLYIVSYDTIYPNPNSSTSFKHRDIIFLLIDFLF